MLALLYLIYPIILLALSPLYFPFLPYSQVLLCNQTKATRFTTSHRHSCWDQYIVPKKKIEKYTPTRIVWSYMIWLYGCFLEWGYPTMGFNTKSWSSMTWMIWGAPIFGNPQKIIANLRYPKISNSELASRYSPTIEFQGRRCDPNSVAYKHSSRAQGYRMRLLIFLFVSDDRNPLQLRPFTSYKL